MVTSNDLNGVGKQLHCQEGVKQLCHSERQMPKCKYSAKSCAGRAAVLIR